MAGTSKDDILPVLLEQQAALSLKPYSIASRLSLAKTYETLGYPDLAAGESYRTILLIDEVLDDSGEYHEQALEEAVQECKKASNLPEEKDVDEEIVCSRVRDDQLPAAYYALVKNLLAIGCVKSAREYFHRGLTREPFHECKESLERKLNDKVAQHSPNGSVDDLPDRTFVRRDLYLWNNHEPNRHAPKAIKELNDQLQSVAPRLEARVTELPVLHDNDAAKTSNIDKTEPETVKQLGLFAKEDIAPGELILNEKSLLTATSVLHGSFCDACSIPLPDIAHHSGSEHSESSESPVSCEECEDIIFCSQECFDLASESYHPSVCGRDVESISKDVPMVEAADSLYSLLLLRSLAMAETQEIEPLELKELKYIWGDYSNNVRRGDSQLDGKPSDDQEPERTLPFSFKYNILIPLHMLEKMDINIFETSSKYDFWVFNTLYAKFRGTASARQDSKGRPEVGAVHPLWCLANHSCDPNVKWDWHGSIKFWAREERILWKGKQDRAPAGLKKDEEVFSHYCDIELGVQDRREWAAGALGGFCTCERCIWEASL